MLRTDLSDIPGLELPPEPAAGRTHVYHQFTVRISDAAGISRDDFVAQLNDRGIGAGVYYPRNVFDYDCYRTHPNVVIDPVPNATRHRA